MWDPLHMLINLGINKGKNKIEKIRAWASQIENLRIQIYKVNKDNLWGIVINNKLLFHFAKIKIVVISLAIQWVALVRLWFLWKVTRSSLVKESLRKNRLVIFL